MEFAYAKATDARVATVVAAAATDGGNRTMSAANLLDFVADAAVDVYSNTLGFATNIVVSPAQWGAIMGLVDSTNRAIYTAVAPMNAGVTHHQYLSQTQSRVGSYTHPSLSHLYLVWN